MIPTRILLLEAAGPESGALVAGAVAAGMEVYVSTHRDIYASYNQDLRASLAGFLFTDFSSLDGAVRAIIEFSIRMDIGGILTVTEFLTPVVTLACAKLALPGNDPDLAFAARNKVTMNEQFIRYGVAAPKTVVLASEDDLTDRLEHGELEFPFVVKPADNAGSADVTVARNATEAMTAYRRTMRHDRQSKYGIALDRTVLAQEYVDGTEYSVESVTQGGRTTHICITRKIVTTSLYRAELGHGVPAVVAPDTAQRILAEVDKAIAAVGIRNGLSHTEVKLDLNGRCAVIEIGARPGAGQIGFLVELALGTEFWTVCIDVALGRPIRVTRPLNNYATVRFLTSPRCGVLASLANLPTPGPRVPIVRVRKTVGENVSVAEDNSARLGCFVVVGRDQQSVDRHADHLLSRVRIEVDPVQLTPPVDTGYPPTGETRDHADPTSSNPDHG